MDAANKQASAAKSAANSQKKVANRIMETYDAMRQVYDQAVASGFFNPETVIQQLESDTARYESRDAGGAAAAYARAGYMPGDTPVERGLSTVKMNYRDYLDRLRLQIRNSKFFDQMNALKMTSPDPSAAGIHANLQQSAEAKAGGMGQFFQTLMPFLGQPAAPQGAGRAPSAPIPGGDAATGGGSLPTVAGPSSWSLGSGGYNNFTPNPAATKKKVLNTSFSFGY